MHMAVVRDMRGSDLPYLSCVFAECTNDRGGGAGGGRRGPHSGCPRPERALLDRVTLNIRAARVPHVRLFPPAFPMPGVLDSRSASFAPRDIGYEPDEFTAGKHTRAGRTSPVNARVVAFPTDGMPYSL